MFTRAGFDALKTGRTLVCSDRQRSDINGEMNTK